MVNLWCLSNRNRSLSIKLTRFVCVKKIDQLKEAVPWGKMDSNVRIETYKEIFKNQKTRWYFIENYFHLLIHYHTFRSPCILWESLWYIFCFLFLEMWFFQSYFVFIDITKNVYLTLVFYFCWYFITGHSKNAFLNIQMLIDNLCCVDSLSMLFIDRSVVP